MLQIKQQKKTQLKSKRISSTKSKFLKTFATISKVLGNKQQGDIYKWLSKNGHVVSITPCASVPKIEKELKKYVRTARLKKCFDNAAKVAQNIAGVNIVIGLFYTGVASGEHAWNVTEDGVHFDVTAEKLKSKGMEAVSVSVMR